MGTVNRYPVGIEKYIPAFKTITAHAINFRAHARMSQTLLRQGREDMQVYVQHLADQLAWDIVLKFSLPGIQRTVSLTTPTTWWSHFKTTWPRWLRRVLFWVKPPLWRTVSVELGQVFPGIKMPDRYGNLVFFDMSVDPEVQWNPLLDIDPIQGYDRVSPPNLPEAKWGGGTIEQQPSESKVEDSRQWDRPDEGTTPEQVAATLKEYTMRGGIEVGDIARVDDPDSPFNGVIGDVVEYEGPLVRIEQFKGQREGVWVEGRKCLKYDNLTGEWKQGGA